MRKRQKKAMQLTPRTVVCWCCERDYPLLPLHYAALRKITNDAILYIYDGYAGEDGKTEVHPPVVPPGAAAVPSTFFRNGNLNGKDCCRGMLEVYQELGRMGVEQILKVDADTICTTLEWVRPGENCGFHGCNGFYWTGCAYSLTMKTIDAMADYLASIDIAPSKGYSLPEDQVFTQLAALVQVDRVNIIEQGMYICTGFMPALMHKPELVRIKGVIHCGQFQRVDPLVGCGLDRTDIVRSDMRFVLRQLYRRNRDKVPYPGMPEHSWISRPKKAGA